jgi:hypothetical protein
VQSKQGHSRKKRAQSKQAFKKEVSTVKAVEAEEFEEEVSTGEAVEAGEFKEEVSTVGVLVVESVTKLPSGIVGGSVELVWLLILS